MNKKIITLIAIILIVIVAGVIVGIGLFSNNESTQQNEETINEEVVENNQTDTQAQQDNTEGESGKVLIVYFSHTGNTETIANYIHEAVGGDIVKLETQEQYTNNYNDLLDVAQQEQRENARPELTTVIDNIDEYDTIFLGYPIWWGDMPMTIYTFLDTYDLSGKTIAPFVTSGGSGLSGTPSNIAQEEPNATVTEGLSILDNNVGNAQSTVNQWLTQIGF